MMSSAPSPAPTIAGSAKMEAVEEISRPRARSQSVEKEEESQVETSDADDVEFVPPLKGTPAAEALAANAAIEVTKYDKVVRRRVKRPKFKNVTRNHKVRQVRRIKGKVIDGVHELYAMTIGMMLGIRVAIGRQHQFTTNDLAVEDFMHVDKYEFPPEGNSKPPNRTPPHSLAHTFKFKNYAPKVFRRIRAMFGIDSANYMLSVCGNYNFLEFISNSKSGQFFFYSHDGRYMIKTQTPEENKFLRRILPHYYKYMVENPNSLLVRFYGMHRVKMYHLRRKVHFVIMGSVFDTTETIHSVYDLKGSTVGRQISEDERARGTVRKDLDLELDGIRLKFGGKREAFLAQLKKDADFLAELNIMDYSLLIGIHDRQQGGPHQQTRSNTPFRRQTDAHETQDIAESVASSMVVHPNRIRAHSAMSSSTYHSRSHSELSDHGPKALHAKSVDYHYDDELKFGFDEQSEFTELDDEYQLEDEYAEESEPNSPGHARRNSAATASSGIMFPDDVIPKTNPAFTHHTASTDALNYLFRPCPWSSRRDSGIVGRQPNGQATSEIYYTGIIDILQQYNATKKLEHLFKSMRYDRHEISAVDAEEYASRFVQFVTDHMD